jgi:hypothetical protein
MNAHPRPAKARPIGRGAPQGRGGRSTRERTPECIASVVDGSASSSPAGRDRARRAWQDTIADSAPPNRGAASLRPGPRPARNTGSAASQGAVARAFWIATSVASKRGAGARALAPRSSQKGAGGDAANAGRAIVHSARRTLAEKIWRRMQRVSNIERGTLSAADPEDLLSAHRRADKPGGRESASTTGMAGRSAKA